MYQSIITGIFFVVCTITDIRWKRVYKSAALSYFLFAAAGQLGLFVSKAIEEGNASVTEFLAALVIGMIPGGLCFLISWVSRQGLGYGDGLLITICGISMGFWRCMWITFTGFFWSGVWAAVMFWLRGADRKKEFPFVPFLLLGYVIQGWGGF